MRVENIVEGRVFKNWKALCEVLEVEPKSHSYRVKQEREFRCYFNWIKEGHKIIITEVNEEPMKKEDGRSNGNRAIFKNGELGDSLVLALERALPHSIGCNYKEYFYSIRDLAREVGLISDRHVLFINHPDQLRLMGLHEVSKCIIGDYKALKSQVEKACGELAERGIVTEYEYSTFIRYKVVEGDDEVFLYRKPTQKELEVIKECEEETVRYFNENKEEFNYRGVNLKEYSNIHAQLPLHISKEVWKYCFKLCRKRVRNYFSHSSKLWIKYDVELLLEAIEHTPLDANLTVNKIYSEKRVGDSYKKYGERVDVMQKELEDKMTSGKGFGKVAEMRKLEVEREHGITLEEAIQLYDKSRKARFIAYTTEDLFNQLATEEERDELQYYIDGLLYKEDLSDTIKNWKTTVTVFKTGSLVKRDAYSRAKFYQIKENFEKFENDKDMVITRSDTYEPGVYSQGEIASAIAMPMGVKMFTEYVWDGTKGRVVIHMLVNNYYYTRIETRTMLNVEFLGLSILRKNKKLTSNSIVFGALTNEKKKEIENLLSSFENGEYIRFTL